MPRELGKRSDRRLQRGGLPVSPLTKELPLSGIVSVALAAGQFPTRLKGLALSRHSLHCAPCLLLPGLSSPFNELSGAIVQSPEHL